MFTSQTQHGTKRLYIPVVREKDLDALKKYQNKGEDRSLLRKYVLNYLYEFITNKIFPTTLAYNNLKHQLTSQTKHGYTNWIFCYFIARISMLSFLSLF
jgi:hypothetical protein